MASIIPILGSEGPDSLNVLATVSNYIYIMSALNRYIGDPNESDLVCVVDPII